MHLEPNMSPSKAGYTLIPSSPPRSPSPPPPFSAPTAISDNASNLANRRNVARGHISVGVDPEADRAVLPLQVTVEVRVGDVAKSPSDKRHRNQCGALIADGLAWLKDIVNVYFTTTMQVVSASAVWVIVAGKGEWLFSWLPWFKAAADALKDAAPA
ncbi:hypothetical protein PENSPDRAFT_294396 [Peniophora sp. CONT]|nr:hypothetical protein PENSPDRAFT_294396 [Peniophora sp. CONT]